MQEIKQTTTSVRCSVCHREIYDGRHLKSRIADFKGQPAKAKCPTCKNWVEVPLVKQQ